MNNRAVFFFENDFKCVAHKTTEIFLFFCMYHQMMKMVIKFGMRVGFIRFIQSLCHAIHCEYDSIECDRKRLS